MGLRYGGRVRERPDGRGIRRRCRAAFFAYFLSLQIGQETYYLVQSTNYFTPGNASDKESKALHGGATPFLFNKIIFFKIPPTYFGFDFLSLQAIFFS
jgi:hypothetical protein